MPQMCLRESKEHRRNLSDCSISITQNHEVHDG